MSVGPLPRRSAPRLLCAFALLAAGAGAPARAEGTLTAYQVREGDTLYQLAQRYLESPQDWHALARLNHVADPKRLPVGSTLMIPADRVRGAVQRATVLYLKGRVLAGEPGRELQVGDEVDEGASLSVHEGAFLGLGLADGSTLHLPALTRLTLERLRQADGIGGHQHQLRLEQGRVETRVRPQPEGSRFDVRTPLAVTGVRGTQFGVALSEDGARSFTEVIAGRVAVAASGLPQAPAQIGGGQGAVIHSATQAPRVLPLLPAPALGEGVGELRVERLPHALALAPVAGAVGYRVQVDAAGEGDAPGTVLFDALTREAAPRLSGLPDGQYRLRVRALDAEGLLGAEATARLQVKATPIAPLARSPQAHAVVGTGMVALRCTEVPGAVAYELQLSADAGFGTLLAEARQSERCAFDLRLGEPAELHWRVASVALRADGTPDRGPFSDPSPLQVVSPPAAPAALDPSEDGQGLHWAGVPGARYQVQLASDEGFTRILRDLEVDRPAVRLDLQACQTYFVRLRTLTSQGLASPFSAPRRVSANAGLCSHDGLPVRSLQGSDWHTTLPR